MVQFQEKSNLKNQIHPTKTNFKYLKSLILITMKGLYSPWNIF